VKIHSEILTTVFFIIWGSKQSRRWDFLVLSGLIVNPLSLIQSFYGEENSTVHL
jgi:hypothetical protein